MTPFKKGILSFIALTVILSIGTIQPILAQPAAQGDESGVNIVTDGLTGVYKFIGVDTQKTSAALPRATFLAGGTPTAQGALADIAAYGKEFGLSNASQEMKLLRTATSRSGSTAFRFQQTYQNIPVFGGQLVANYDGRGRLAALVGKTSPNLAISTTAKITDQQAADIALKIVAKQENVPAAQLSAAPATQAIYDSRLLVPDGFAPRLVWQVEVRSTQHLPIRYMVLVNASTGGVALAFNQIDRAWGDAAAKTGAIPKVSAPAFSPQLSTLNFAYNPAGSTYNSGGTSSRGGTGFSVLVCNTPPTAVKGAGSCDGTPSATAANEAHYFAYDTVNYYKSHHGRNSIDDANLALISNVNYRPGIQPYMNAFWDGTQMTYGDGATFTADDVVGHELTHGVTEHSSGLIYYAEPGAINESMSDIFGELIDQANGITSSGSPETTAHNWEQGEDVVGINGIIFTGPIRDMKNPGRFNQPDNTQSSLYYKKSDDENGVHENSGVGNKAAYLMAAGGSFNGYTIFGLGNNKTSSIYYEVNNNLLSASADYQMLGAALIQACNNLALSNTDGITAANCLEVQKVVKATKMDIPAGGPTNRPQVSVCPTGFAQNDVLLNDDFEHANPFQNFVAGTIVNQSSMPPSDSWQEASSVGEEYAVSGTKSLLGINFPEELGYSSGFYESYLTLANPLVLPTGSEYYLHFNHVVAMEASLSGTAGFDGGILEYELDGSGVWTDAATLFDGGQNYNGTINLFWGNPLAGHKAFVETSRGYVSTRYKLKSLAGHTVNFRWVISADDIGYDLGWFLDDVQVYNCLSLTAAPERNFYTSSPTLTWSQVSWATGYELQIAPNSAFMGASSYTFDANTLSWDVPAQAPGQTQRYWWRVRALKSGAAPGPWSAVESFTVKTP
jgi:Zn-dependent metalloprotease